MQLKKIDHDLTVCKVESENELDLTKDFYFIGKTEEEISLVCITDDVPIQTLEREDGWKAFRIQGVLDFSLIGILSKISTILPSDDSLFKMLYLATMDITKKWGGRNRDWNQILAQLCIYFENRISLSDID